MLSSVLASWGELFFAALPHDTLPWLYLLLMLLNYHRYGYVIYQQRITMIRKRDPGNFGVYRLIFQMGNSDRNFI